MWFTVTALDELVDRSPVKIPSRPVDFPNHCIYLSKVCNASWITWNVAQNVIFKEDLCMVGHILFSWIVKTGGMGPWTLVSDPTMPGRLRSWLVGHFTAGGSIPPRLCFKLINVSLVLHNENKTFREGRYYKIYMARIFFSLFFSSSCFPSFFLFHQSRLPLKGV